MSREVIVVGAGMGGLAVALYLRKAGLIVTVFEKRPQVGGRANRIVHNGFTFDTGPSLLNYPWVFRRLFTHVDRCLDAYVELLPIDPSLRFYWQDGATLELSTRFEVLAEQFSRFEPAAAGKLALFMRDNLKRFNLLFDRLVTSPAQSYWEWFRALRWREIATLGITRSLDRELSKYFQSQRIRAALGSYAMYLGGSPYILPGTFSILPFGELYYGLWYPRGGMYALIDAVRRIAEEMGITIHCNEQVQRIRTRNQRVIGVELQDGRFYPSDLVVANVDVPTALSMVEDYPQCRRRYSMTPGVITFYWGVEKTLDLHHHCIFLPDDPKKAYKELRSGLPSDLPFYLCAPSLTDQSVAPPGSTTLFALVPTPTISAVKAKFSWEKAIDLARVEIMRRLHSHGIALDIQSISYEQVWSPLQWREYFGLYEGSAFGLDHTLWNIGPGRLPNRDRYINGLYFVGASTVPGTGLPMVTLGGMMTARQILDDLC